MSDQTFGLRPDEHTSGPCGCRIDPVAGAWRIHYCPTHAAAFETAEKLRVKEGLLEAALEKPMRDAVTIADLLAALKPFVRDELPEGDEYADPWLVGVSDAELQAARAAITAAIQGESAE